ncbi:MAG: PorT family protein [Chitinophagaceae bacterium]|nr:PorT family protein [Chitinophagaceae bacterium]MDB5221803.1 PorT family protein [Chitinophagaceae bacterium]
MKKLLVTAFAFAMLTNAKAQLYLQGGVNLANITKTTSGQTEDNNMLTTFNVGILNRWGLSKVVDLESGVLFTGRGSKAETYYTSGNTTDNYVKTKFNPYYIEVPLNIVVRVPLQKTYGLFFHAGPYAAIGVAGKSTTDQKLIGITSHSENDIQYANDDPFTSRQEDASYYKLKRFDFGLNVGGGFDLGKLLLKVNYGYGLTKINSTESNNASDDKNKYRTLSFSVGVPIGK